MFIRKKENISKRTGLCSTYYELVESIRTENGSTNRVLLYLGKLEITLAEQKTLSSIIDRKVKGFSREVRFSDKIEELAELIYQKYKQKFDSSNKSLKLISVLIQCSILRMVLEYGLDKQLNLKKKRRKSIHY